MARFCIPTQNLRSRVKKGGCFCTLIIHRPETLMANGGGWLETCRGSFCFCSVGVLGGEVGRDVEPLDYGDTYRIKDSDESLIRRALFDGNENRLLVSHLFFGGVFWGVGVYNITAGVFRAFLNEPVQFEDVHAVV